MKKKIFGGILAVAIAAVAAVNVNFNNEAEGALSALSLANVEALAQDESGGGSGKQYHINNPQSCKGTETRRCDISVYVPGYGQCSVGFDYTVNFNGTSNYCTYTGNKDAYCNYHTCIRN